MQHKKVKTPAERHVTRSAARVGVLGLVLAGTFAFVQVDAGFGAASDDVAVADAGAADVAALDADLAARTPSAASRALAGERSEPVTVEVRLDSGVQTVQTDGASVRDVLGQVGAVLEPDTVLSAGLDEPVVDGMSISARTAETTTETVTEVVPFGSTETADAALVKDRRVVQTAGIEGRSDTTYLVRRVDGVEVDRTVVASVVLSEVRDEVVRVGTMEVPDASASVLTPDEARALGAVLVAERGWDESQFTCLNSLWTKESNWRVQAANASSGAYGIPQSLPGSKMASVAADWQTNAQTQITWGLNYIAGRYGTPCAAWSASQSKGWY